MLIVVDLDNESHTPLLPNIFTIANRLAFPEVASITIYYTSSPLEPFSAEGGSYVFAIKDKDDCEVFASVLVRQLKNPADSWLLNRFTEMLQHKLDAAHQANPPATAVANLG